jgi:hypothetical protein
MPHAAGVETGVPMAPYVLQYLVRIDTSSSLSVPEGPDGGLYARESFFQRLEG